MSDRVFEISARPGTIKKEYPVRIPRPRVEQDPQLLMLQTKIMGSLKDEIDKVAKEQLDLDYGLDKNIDQVPAERNLGSNI